MRKKKKINNLVLNSSIKISNSQYLIVYRNRLKLIVYNQMGDIDNIIPQRKIAKYLKEYLIYTKAGEPEEI